MPPAFYIPIRICCQEITSQNCVLESRITLYTNENKAINRISNYLGPDEGGRHIYTLHTMW